MKSFEVSLVLTTQAKPSLRTPDLAVQLQKRTQQYARLFGLIEAAESKKKSIEEASQVIQELNFEEDCCDIKRFISKKCIEVTYPT